MKPSLWHSTLIICCLTIASTPKAAWAEPPIVVGSKAFTEGFVLAEYAAQTLEAAGQVNVQRRFGLGGTGLLAEALRSGDIDVYPEYLGTIASAILARPDLTTVATVRNVLEERGLTISEPLGFSNSYAIATTRAFAERFKLRTLIDLRGLAAAQARSVFSHEFMSRADGYALAARNCGLTLTTAPRAMEHVLAYQAIASGLADVIDVYTTDARIETLDLVALVDERGCFPDYAAVLLARKDFVRAHPRAWLALQAMVGRFDVHKMRRLNGAIDLEHKSIASVVASERGEPGRAAPSDNQLLQDVLGRTGEHLELVALALAFSVIFGIPLGVLASRRPRLSQAILLVSGTAQTIPSLALLCLLIPIFGIGSKPALAALCIYGLLPVVLNTYTGLRGIDPRILDAARSLGLGSWNQFRLIELPLASPQILAGMKTSAIVGIGTATLAALIGAGGYGAPILAGLAINNVPMILTGAIPAAAMAIGAHFFFEGLGRLVIPRALRKR